MSRHRMRHQAEVSPRALYGLFVLVVGLGLIVMAAIDFSPGLSPLAYVVGGACLSSALYEFTSD